MVTLLQIQQCAFCSASHAPMPYSSEAPVVTVGIACSGLKVRHCMSAALKCECCIRGGLAESRAHVPSDVLRLLFHWARGTGQS